MAEEVCGHTAEEGLVLEKKKKGSYQPAHNVAGFPGQLTKAEGVGRAEAVVEADRHVLQGDQHAFLCAQSDSGDAGMDQLGGPRDLPPPGLRVRPPGPRSPRHLPAAAC